MPHISPYLPLGRTKASKGYILSRKTQRAIIGHIMAIYELAIYSYINIIAI